MNRGNRLLIFAVSFLLISVTLAGCGLLSAPQPTPDLLATSVAQTIAAELTRAAEETPIPPSPTQVTVQPEPTATEPPSTPTLSPTPTIDDAACNRVEFVTDVTIEDDTALAPEATFLKVWRLRNVGECTWTTDYALVFVDGDQMDGDDEIALPRDVAPEETVDLSVELKAPEAEGSYQGNWQLRNDAGRLFGIGEEWDEAFWVKIVVEEGGDELALGDPTWRDTFASGANWFLVDTEETYFEVKDGNLIMEAIPAGTYDNWGLSIRPAIKDFYLEITARTGAVCSGLDDYGVLIRAPDKEQGYVYGFSCNGRYRIYKWDGENYTGLQAWRASPHILSGPNQTNRLGIWAEGDTFRLYANGKFLAEVSDDEYKEGRFGLFIGSSETAHFKVYVEEVAYWLIGD
ncbi:MAG: hypothetical protein AMJ88_05815 [Anaerolineae bacterium SM23_ 63]|nr:MAG: hypothetical protein AMJ88_05815 [Anaerolineae bacterium SM23_ 63]HEY47737.1 DUF1080 domain-containing protein [Anaerolineae bacterium]